jgi:hypothetical protein
VNRSVKSLLSKHVRTAAFLAPFAIGSVVVAQPGGTPVPPPPPTDVPVVAPVVDEARINELVDRRIAKIMEERAAKEAAEAAAKAAAAKDSKPATEGKAVGESGGSGIVDARLNFTCGHENLLVKPGETIPSVPGLRCGVPRSSALLFFDNYDTRFNGFENLDHQVLYKRVERGHYDAEGALVLRTNFGADGIIFDDGGSYLSVAWWQNANRKTGNRVRFTGFPNNSDRMRLGYSYRISWGGNEDFQRVGRAKPPGLKIQFDNDHAYAFIGGKTSLFLDNTDANEYSTGAVLGGAGVDISDLLRVEFNGGVFRRGKNELQDVKNQPVDLFGGSVQIAAHKGMAVQSSIDYKLYKYDADRVIQFFQRAKYPGGFAWLVMAEGTLIGQTLKDAEKTGSTKIQYGAAGDINVRIMLDRMRFRFDAQYRNLEYVLHSQPSLPTYSTFPKEYTTGPDIFAAIGADKNWNDSLTLGIQAGLERPAVLTTPSSIPGGATADSGNGKTTSVIRSPVLTTTLPIGKSAVPMFAAKVTAQFDFNQYFAVVGNAFYTYDGNTAREDRDNPEAGLRYVFGNFNQFGFNITLQARI